MPDTPRSNRSIPSEPPRAERRPEPAREALSKAIPRRASVSWWLGIILALGFATIVTPAITAERWLLRFHAGTVTEGAEAPFTVRGPMLTGADPLRADGGLVIARGAAATHDEAVAADAIARAMPGDPLVYAALFALTFVLAALFSHHMRRSIKGRLVRVQVVSLAVIAVIAVAVKIVLLATALSALVVPIGVLAIVPTMALDRTVGLATGVLAALVVSLLVPFDVSLAILLLAQAATAGLMIAEHPKRPWTAAWTAGAAATLCTSASYLLLIYLTTGRGPALGDPLHAAWLAAALGPAIAALVAVPVLPAYQLLVGEITQARLFALEDLGQPLLRQIAERSPGTWQHSLMMANMAEIAANAIGANGRLVRVGAYFHDLGKSLQAKYFIENLEAGETSPHDQLPPEVSCDAIFAHVTEGIVAARRAGLHERIVDFMHMHHGNGVLEYFWAKCRDQGNPNGFTVEKFRYPGHPPQSRETAILAICDAVEAASRTLKKPDAPAIDALVQRIVYGKLHLGQLDESGLSMADLRRISDSLRETIRHANHGRIEYPWQTAGQDASASAITSAHTSTAPRLDSLDRIPHTPGRQPVARSLPPPREPTSSDDAFAATADLRIERGERIGRGENMAGGDPVPAAARAARDTEPRTAPSRSTRSARDADPRAMLDSGRTPRASERASERGSPYETGRVGRVTERGAMPLTAHPPAAQRDRASTTDAAPPPAIALREIAPAQTEDNRPTTPMAQAEDNRPTTPMAQASVPVEPDTAPRPTPTDSTDAATKPSLRRGPSGHPPVPSDPAQLAATLASIATRINTAAFATIAPDELERSAVRSSEIAAPDSDARTANEPARAARQAEVEAAGAAAQPAAPRTTTPPHEPRKPSPTPRAGSSSPASPASRTPSPTPALAQPVAPPSAVSVSRGASPSTMAAILPSMPYTADLDAAIVQPSLGPLLLPSSAIRGPRMAEASSTLQPPAVAATPTASSRPPLDVDERLLERSEIGGGDPAGSAGGARGKASRRIDNAVTRPKLDAAVLPASLRTAVDPDDAVTRLSMGTRDPVTIRRAAPAPGAPSAAGSRPLPVEERGENPTRTARERPGAALLDEAPSIPVIEINHPRGERRAEHRRRAAPLVSRSDGEDSPWGSGLAARIDAALDSDEWGQETPIVPPNEAALRTLFGQPDPTRQQPHDEIQRLQRRAAELADDPPRRSPHPTAEVDPDDIEAAIEVAPPARRLSHTKPATAKPKKSE